MGILSKIGKILDPGGILGKVDPGTKLINKGIGKADAWIDSKLGKGANGQQQQTQTKKRVRRRSNAMQRYNAARSRFGLTPYQSYSKTMGKDLASGSRKYNAMTAAQGRKFGGFFGAARKAALAPRKTTARKLPSTNTPTKRFGSRRLPNTGLRYIGRR